MLGLLDVDGMLTLSSFWGFTLCGGPFFNILVRLWRILLCLIFISVGSDTCSFKKCTNSLAANSVQLSSDRDKVLQ